jgi:uncharacterized membrane protein
MLQKFKQNRLLQALLFASASGIGLLFFRVYWSGRFTYFFMPTNLLLAWIPLVLSLYLPQKKGPLSLKVVLLLFFWLLFFPNAPYLITDLVHLRSRPGMPFLFDIVLLSSFAWTGLTTGFLSLLKIHEFLLLHFKPKGSWLLVTGLIMLSSFGIYLGRFQRWNSWDLVVRPHLLFADILNIMFHPFSEPKAVGITAIFTVFLFSAYLTFYFLAKPLKGSGQQKR